MATEFEKLVVLVEASVSKFDKDIQNLSKGVDTAMRQIEDRTARSTSAVERNVEALASKLTGMRNLFTPLGAAAVAFSAMRFGENIIANIDEITKKAHLLNIAIDQDSVNAIRHANSEWEKAVVAMEAGLTPLVATWSRILAMVLEYGKAQPRTGSYLGFGGTPVAKPPMHEAAKAAGIPFAPGDPNKAFLDNLAKDVEKRQAEAKRAAEKAASEQEQALRALDATDEFLANEKIKRAHETAQEQIKALEDVARANEKFEATVSRLHDKELNDRLDASIAEFREYQRIEEDRARDVERINRQIADDIASFGDIMDEAGGKFGKAVELMILDLAKLMLKMEATKALSSALHDIDTASGGAGFFGSVMKLIGLRAEGGPVSSGSPYVVGEQGPEIFVPTVSGTIIPNIPAASPGGVQNRFQIVVNGARGNTEIRDMVSAGVQQGIAVYDRQALPARVARLNADPQGAMTEAELRYRAAMASCEILRDLLRQAIAMLKLMAPADQARLAASTDIDAMRHELATATADLERCAAVLLQGENAVRN